MLLLRDLPTDGELCQMAQRYPDLQPAVCAGLLAMLRAATDVFQSAESHFMAHGLSCGRFTVLALLNRDPAQALTPSQIADSCGVTRATITGLLDGLEADGYISRSRDDADRRTLLVRLTPTGQQFLDGVLPEHFRRMGRLIAGLSDADRQHLRRICDTISANAQANRPSPTPSTP